MDFVGDCPFCIVEYPDGQEFCRTEKISRNGDEVFSWEICFSCSNCGVCFLVGSDLEEPDEEHDLRDKLKIKEQAGGLSDAEREKFFAEQDARKKILIGG